MGCPFIELTVLPNRKEVVMDAREIIVVINNTQDGDQSNETHVWIGEGVIKVAEGVMTVIALMEAARGEKLLERSSQHKAQMSAFLDAANTKRIK
jgi:F0F1-type ATP synthase epsilon subunit